METPEDIAVVEVPVPALVPPALYSWWLWRKAPGELSCFTIVGRDRHVETNQITHVYVLEQGSSNPVRYALEKFWQPMLEISPVKTPKSNENKTGN